MLSAVTRRGNITRGICIRIAGQRRSASNGGKSTQQHGKPVPLPIYEAGVLGKQTGRGPTLLSRRFVPTVKADAIGAHGNDLESLKLLIRGGYIRQSSSGIFTLLPNGLRLARKVEAIVTEEMDRIGASRLEMPMLLSSSLWHKSGRFDTMGSELYKLTDRKGSQFVLAPTFEEEVTNMVGEAVHSWRQLPVRLYQVTRKHRDEPRPRNGLLRTREFVMKDLYTFDANLEDARETYELVRGAYGRIMTRLFGAKGKGWRVAQADTGAMGGQQSHEYHVEDDAGEDTILSCGSCSYTANSELAASLPSRGPDVPLEADDVQVNLFGSTDKLAHRCTLTAFVSPKKRAVNAVKLARHLPNDQGPVDALKQGGAEVEWDWKDRPEGPMVRFDKLRVIVDYECAGVEMQELDEAVLAAVERYGSLGPAGSTVKPRLSDFFPSQLRVVDNDNDSVSPLPMDLQDLREAEAGDECAACRTGKLRSSKAIEVGHTFLLGTKYSSSLDVGFTPSEPSSSAAKKGAKTPFEMGCYGIGISRIMAVIAQRACATPSSKSILAWPHAVAPFSALILLTGGGENATRKVEASHKLVSILSSNHGGAPGSLFPDLAASALSDTSTEEGGLSEGTRQFLESQYCIEAEDIALDDRIGMSVGARLAEADLVGYPLVFILGNHFDRDGNVEVRLRVFSDAHDEAGRVQSRVETKLIPFRDIQGHVE